MTWQPLPHWRQFLGVHHERPDPFVVWAGATRWRNYPASQPVPPPVWCRIFHCLLNRVTALFRGRGAPSMPEPELRPVILELSDDEAKRKAFRAAVSRDPLKGDVRVPLAYGETYRFATARVTPAGLKALADRNSPIGAGVKRFDLSDVIVPSDSAGVLKVNLANPKLRPKLNGGVLLGLVDNGCPFAHARFSPVVANGQYQGLPELSTRVAAYWDQETPRRPVAEGSVYGHLSLGFGYGREIYRDYGGAVAQPFTGPRRRKAKTRLLGFADLLQKLLGQGCREEESFYEEIDLPSMRGRVAHGPHVMDVLAGPVRARDRVYLERDDPPTWARADDVAGKPDKSDLVFVQLPRECLQDSSGIWLDSHILDAVTYILSCSSKDTKKVVITISYGNTVGPHDGTSILATALQRLVDNAQTPLDIVFAGGNSFRLRGHASFDADATGTALTWRIPPASKTPHFMQIWLPRGTDALGAGAAVVVQPPGAQAFTLAFPPRGPHTPAVPEGEVFAWPSADDPQAVVTLLQAPSRGDGSPLIFIAVSATDAGGPQAGTPAPHGDWTITVKAQTPLRHLHAYIARNDRDIGGPLVGRQSYFVDVADDGGRFLRVPNDDHGFDPRDTELFESRRGAGVVKRRGTLNGVPAGAGSISAVAGFSREFTDDTTRGVHSRYSAAGWVRESSGDNRSCVPDGALPTDQSHVLRGLRAAGTRSSSTYRLVGTSTAAPQRARALANVPVAVGPPVPTQTQAYGLDLELDGLNRGQINNIP